MTRRLIIILLIVSLFSSCSRKTQPIGGAESLVIYPAPPDTTRIQYLTSFSSAQDVTGRQRSFAKFILGGGEDITINKPYGIAVAKGKIYICDTFIKGLQIVDMNENSFESFIPTGPGQLGVPINCFVDEKGFLYIADTERKQIVIFNEKSEYYNSFGEAENFKPGDVMVLKDTIWVSNISGHCISVYSNDSSFSKLNSFPGSEPGNEEYLFSPTNLYVTDDEVYVTDFGAFIIKVYNHRGEFIRSIGSYGQNPGQFVRPKGIAVDKELNLYVVDAGFENAQIFNQRGELLMHFGGSYKGPGDMWLPAKVILDYNHLSFFEKFVDPAFDLVYLIFITNQYGPDKINVYGYVTAASPGQKEGKPIKKKKSGRNDPMF